MLTDHRGATHDQRVAIIIEEVADHEGVAPRTVALHAHDAALLVLHRDRIGRRDQRGVGRAKVLRVLARRCEARDLFPALIGPLEEERVVTIDHDGELVLEADHGAERAQSGSIQLALIALGCAHQDLAVGAVAVPEGGDVEVGLGVDGATDRVHQTGDHVGHAVVAELADRTILVVHGVEGCVAVRAHEAAQVGRVRQAGGHLRGRAVAVVVEENAVAVLVVVVDHDVGLDVVLRAAAFEQLRSGHTPHARVDELVVLIAVKVQLAVVSLGAGVIPVTIGVPVVVVRAQGGIRQELAEALVIERTGYAHGEAKQAKHDSGHCSSSFVSSSPFHSFLHNARNRKRVLGFHLKQSTQNCAHCFRRSQVSRNTVN